MPDPGIDTPEGAFGPTIDETPLRNLVKRVLLTVIRPSFWAKILLTLALFLVSVEVYGAGGLFLAVAAIGGYHAIRVGLREGWKASPVAIVLVVLGVVFMALFFVHYNSLTCPVKGGWTIDLGDGNSVCIGPS